MFVLEACRSCLTVNGKLEKLPPALIRFYNAFTEQNVVVGDGYPTMFCMECRLQIKKALAFRRKTKRAYFVLKEIMTVKQQVSFSDILKVDRTRTNLDSTLGFWKNQNLGFFAIDNDTEENGEMVKFEPVKDELSVYHLVDIKSDMIDIEDDNNKEDLEEDNENVEPQAMDTIDTSNIDMEDIFKGLPDDFDDVASVAEKDDFEFTPKPKREPLNPALQGYIKALCNSNISVLSFKEQKEDFEMRKNEEKFRLARNKCIMCLKIYEDKVELLKHAEYHCKNHSGPILCTVCLIRFPANNALLEHVYSNHLFKFACKHCDYVTHSLDKISEHYANMHRVERHRLVRKKKDKTLRGKFVKTLLTPELMNVNNSSLWERKRFVCDDCGIGFRKRSSLDLHRSNHVPRNGKRQKVIRCCDICEMQTSSKPNIARHMESRHMYCYTCVKCSMVFNSRHTALYHMLNKCNNPKKTWQCTICLRSYKAQHVLTKHQRKVHNTVIQSGSQKKRFHCNMCGLFFELESTYYKHQLVDHNYISPNHPLIGDPDFRCAECAINFVDERSYNKHLLLMGHEEAKNVQNACRKCNIIFDTAEEMESHPCNSIFPQSCRYCEMVLTDVNEYLEHYQTVHSGLEFIPPETTSAVICELCGKYISKSSFYPHRASHNNNNRQKDTSYACPYCDYLPLSATTHFSHVVSKHTPKPYICSICYSRFDGKGLVRDHVQKCHLPEKFYKCEMCQAKYGRLDHLIRHSKKVHGMTDVPEHYRRKNIFKHKILYVYPDMKIDSCMVDEKICKEVQLSVLDYMDQNPEPAENPEDYFIRMPASSPDFKIQKEKRVLPKKKKSKRASNVVSDTGEIEYDYSKEETESKFDKIDYYDESDEYVSQNEVVIDSSEQNILKIEGDSLEVVIRDNEQYVNINGTLYKIEPDDAHEV